MIAVLPDGAGEVYRFGLVQNLDRVAALLVPCECLEVLVARVIEPRDREDALASAGPPAGGACSRGDDDGNTGGPARTADPASLLRPLRWPSCSMPMLDRRIRYRADSTGRGSTGWCNSW